MPTYEYVCPGCFATKSLSLTMAEYDETGPLKCDVCSVEMRRAWSPPGIEIK